MWRKWEIISPAPRVIIVVSTYAREFNLHSFVEYSINARM